MIFILSPAKNMAEPEELSGWMEKNASLPLSQPVFLRDAAQLAGQLKSLNPWQLESILGVNPVLALKAFGLYQNFDAKKEGIPALLAYQGLQYQHLAAGDFSADDLESAQQRLRIVSGLYGLLRPLDSILPYRLEMQCTFPFNGKRLYPFWGARLWEEIAPLNESLVNLASREYAKAVVPYASGRIVSCDFLTPKRGKLVCIATAAKMARGEMARMAVKQRLTQPEELQRFQWGGFIFQPKLSTEDRYVFVASDG